MKVLFVSSGNSTFGISPIVKNQGESLIASGINVEYFLINGKGISGYLKSIPKLRKKLQTNRFDIVHAHYSLSAIVATLAGAKHLVVSLMGSDTKTNFIIKIFIKLFNTLFWKKVIVKSEDMKQSIGIKNAEVIPNGVNLKLFKEIDKLEAQKHLRWEIGKKYILFAANPNRYEKNFSLAKQSFNSINTENVELKVLQNVKFSDMPYYHNAADVILLTSLWEGSPNVIKEAMACNRPIVATKVGDIPMLFNQINGCYLCDFSKTEIAANLDIAINYSQKNNTTNARNRILDLKLSLDEVALRLKKLYEQIQKNAIIKQNK